MGQPHEIRPLLYNEVGRNTYMVDGDQMGADWSDARPHTVYVYVYVLYVYIYKYIYIYIQYIYSICMYIHYIIY